ncbi:MAG: M24 family metallopeptidase [Candidatus Acidiferrales bacterium]
MTNSDWHFGHRFPRRTFLQSASTGFAASLAGSFLPVWARPAQSATSTPKGMQPLTPASMPKAWSLEEMQRRWNITRRKMKELQLDCLLVSQHHSGEMISERIDGDADVEWFTGNSLPFKYVILPLEGKVTAFSTAQVRGTPEEKMAAERGIDLRIVPGEQMWSAPMIDSLREMNMAQARIGVTDLANAPRQPEGEISYTTYDRILKAFPQAKFEAVGGLLWKLKLVHSPEEIAVLEKATLVSEVGIQAMMATARPGVIHRVVWLAMYEAMVNASGERPWRVSIRTGAGGNSALNRPLEEVMPAGQVLTQECTGCVLGYGSQTNQSVLLGPASADWTSLSRYCLDTFHIVMDAVVPGKTIHEILAVYDKRLVEKGEKPGGLIFHSGGLGDLPRTGSNGEGSDVVIEPGMVFDIKPEFRLKGRGVVQIGDSVVVTDKGARRLGRRDMSPNNLA